MCYFTDAGAQRGRGGEEEEEGRGDWKEGMRERRGKTERRRKV